MMERGRMYTKEEILGVLLDFIHRGTCTEHETNGLCDAMKIVMWYKEGKWIKRTDDGTIIFECSNCHQVKPYEIGNSPDELIFWECNYCPECGAKMEEEKRRCDK